MRTWFRWSPPYRAVRGGLVIDLQSALARAGHLASVDGVFAGQTQLALKAWQAARRQPVTGEVDELALAGLTGVARPPLFRRCLAMTAAFEGHGYTLAVGNFDGAYLTWGIIGFTLKGGNLGEVISRLAVRQPALLAETIGPDKAEELLRIVRSPSAARKAWADRLSMGAKKYNLRPDWRDAFEALGNRREVREVQDEVAHDVYWVRAVRDLRRYGQPTEIDAALFYDTAVQNGGVDAAKAAAIAAAQASLPAGAGARQRLAAVAEAIAAGSSATYRNDVRDRRMTLAQGVGEVHGAAYQVADWGLDDQPIADTDLL